MSSFCRYYRFQHFSLSSCSLGLEETREVQTHLLIEHLWTVSSQCLCSGLLNDQHVQNWAFVTHQWNGSRSLGSSSLVLCMWRTQCIFGFWCSQAVCVAFPVNWLQRCTFIDKLINCCLFIVVSHWLLVFKWSKVVEFSNSLTSANLPCFIPWISWWQIPLVPLVPVALCVASLKLYMRKRTLVNSTFVSFSFFLQG